MKVSILTIFLTVTLLASYCQSVESKLLYLENGDTIYDHDSLKIYYKTPEKLINLYENDLILCDRIGLDSVRKIVIVLNKDTLEFFDSENAQFFSVFRRVDCKG